MGTISILKGLVLNQDGWVYLLSNVGTPENPVEGDWREQLAQHPTIPTTTVRVAQRFNSATWDTTVTDGVVLLDEGQVPKSDGDGGFLYAGATVDPVTEEWTFDKTANFPQDSVRIGPAVQLSDQGGFLGVANIADGLSSIAALSRTYETEAERDSLFPDSVVKLSYQYLLPAKWVNQFAFDSDISSSNSVFWELEDSDSTLYREFFLFSATARTGVRIFIENILPGGDALVWENVTEKEYNEGQGQVLTAGGQSRVVLGFVKVATANVRLRFTFQAQPTEVLNLIGENIDLGFGSYFYTKLLSYSQDIFETNVPDFQSLSAGSFGEFDTHLNFDSTNANIRSIETPTDNIIQPIFTEAITEDRPEFEFVNGSEPVVINSITVKHTGTWSPVQVSFNDLRTVSISLVDGDNIISIGPSPLTIEAGATFVFRFTGATGTGSQTQISLLGNVAQEPYFSLNTNEVTSKQITTLFGQEYQFESDETESTTTETAVFQNKLTLTTQVIPTGTYKGSITCAVTNDSGNKTVTIQTELDGTPVNESSYSPKDGNEFIVKTVFSNADVSSGVHTIDLNYKAGSTGGTAKIKNARIEIFRVG